MYKVLSALKVLAFQRSFFFREDSGCECSGPFPGLVCGKRDLVSRRVMAQPKGSGGFSVISIEFKVAALLVQWVRRLAVCPNGWVYLLTFWLLDRHEVPPYTFFSDPSSFSAASFPPFYSDLFRAWRAVDGGSSHSGLALSSSSGNAGPVESTSCKSAYSVLLSLNPATPH